MPEGPEAYIMSKYLEKYILNKKFVSITSNTKTKVDLPNKSSVIKLESYGKVITIITKDYYVNIHLGITGWLVTKKPKIYKYVLNFSNKSFYLQDRRRFSSIKIFKKEDHINYINSKYGVDILSKEFTYKKFKSYFINTNKNICSLLLDQKYFAGLGNYIKNEALYLSKISPLRKTSTLKEYQLKRLFNMIKFVSFSNLVDWHIEYKIKISKDLKDLLPEKLDVPYEFYIFEKEYDSKGNKITFDKSHCGRRTYYVKKIQK